MDENKIQEELEKIRKEWIKLKEEKRELLKEKTDFNKYKMRFEKSKMKLEKTKLKPKRKVSSLNTYNLILSNELREFIKKNGHDIDNYMDIDFNKYKKINFNYLEILKYVQDYFKNNFIEHIVDEKKN